MKNRAIAALIERYAGPVEAVAPLAVLLERLKAPNAPTSIHEPEMALSIHLADSMSGLLVPALRDARTIADLGSGAGLPGLVLAAVLPDARIALVEANGRKCDFLRDAALQMETGNVEVVRARAEEWVDGLERFEVVTARAVATLAVLAEYAAPLLVEAGCLVAWKGLVSPDEETASAAAAVRLGLTSQPPMSVKPFRGSERRTLHVLRKTSPTPPGFPRRAGMAAKRPLA